jgi:retron-type reverse transcriptase
VLEFDIKGLFDNIDHDLLMRAVRKHTDCKWMLLYIERWLKAPFPGGGWDRGREDERDSSRRSY